MAIRKVNLLHSQFWEAFLINIQLDTNKGELTCGLACFKKIARERITVVHPGDKKMSFSIFLPDRVRQTPTSVVYPQGLQFSWIHPPKTEEYSLLKR